MSGKVLITPKGFACLNLTDLGAKPNVLIDNNTYPIPSNPRTDRNVQIGLHKVETDNTEVTDDELSGLPYDKRSTVLDDHGLVLDEGVTGHMTWSLGPNANAASTPIIETTGAAASYNPLFKKCTPEDLSTLQLRLNLLKIPQSGRILVLDPRHVKDLADADQKFENQFHVIQTGRPVNMYGFMIYMYMANPFYAGADLANYAKQAFGTAYNQGVGAAAVRHHHASIAYHPAMCWKARSRAFMYCSRAETNPANRLAEVGFRMYIKAGPILPQNMAAQTGTTHGIAAIVSSDVA